jgi:hypothetical protein
MGNITTFEHVTTDTKQDHDDNSNCVGLIRRQVWHKF